jgi:hypothetical protein
VVTLATVLLAAACTGPTATGPDQAPGGPSAPGAGDGATGTSEPTGRTVATDSEFDREPCAAASATEVRDALAEPFNVIAGNLLAPEGSPVVLSGDDAGPGGAAGCEYRLVAESTDTSEAYHLITVRLVRLDSGGPQLLSACQDAAAANPMSYRVLDLGDGSCVGPGAVLSLLVGTIHYSITAAAVPGRADQTDEDFRLGTLAEAAGTVLADRLPAG